MYLPPASNGIVLERGGDAGRKQTAEGSGEHGGTEEDSQPKTKFFTGVPAREDECYTSEKGGLLSRQLRARKGVHKAFQLTSVAPRKNRQAAMPAKLNVAAVQALTAPLKSESAGVISSLAPRATAG